jgi:hypothetical protein
MLPSVSSVIREVAIGLGAAWRAPDVIARGLGPLLQPAAPTRSADGAVGDPPLAARVAHSAVARLARIAPSRWSNTCLYRSVAECGALRALTRPARVVIGVGTDAVRDDVIAHAWVECEGVRCLATRGQAELETMSAPSLRPGTRAAAP